MDISLWVIKSIFFLYLPRKKSGGCLQRKQTYIHTFQISNPEANKFNIFFFICFLLILYQNTIWYFRMWKEQYEFCKIISFTYVHFRIFVSLELRKAVDRALSEWMRVRCWDLSLIRPIHGRIQEGEEYMPPPLPPSPPPYFFKMFFNPNHNGI